MPRPGLLRKRGGADTCLDPRGDKNCQSSNSRTYEKGQVPLIPDEFQMFLSHKCVRDD